MVGGSKFAGGTAFCCWRLVIRMIPTSHVFCQGAIAERSSPLYYSGASGSAISLQTCGQFDAAANHRMSLFARIRTCTDGRRVECTVRRRTELKPVHLMRRVPPSDQLQCIKPEIIASYSGLEAYKP